MRLFAGIALPPEAAAPLLAQVDRWRPLGDIAWTSEEKLHITTKFIGEWPESRLDELQQALAGVRVTEPVDIRIQGFGWMASALYAGAEMPLELARVTEDSLRSLGIPKETRAYRPHVTLGRARRKASVEDLRREAARSELRLAPFRATAFHLYLSANGTYTRLRSYPLPS